MFHGWIDQIQKSGTTTHIEASLRLPPASPPVVPSVPAAMPPSGFALRSEPSTPPTQLFLNPTIVPTDLVQRAERYRNPQATGVTVTALEEWAMRAEQNYMQGIKTLGTFLDRAMRPFSPTLANTPMNRWMAHPQRGAVGITVPKMTDAELAQHLAVLLDSRRPHEIYRQQFREGRFDLMQVIRLATSNGVGRENGLSILNDFASPYNDPFHAAFTAEHLAIFIPQLSRRHSGFSAILETLSSSAVNHFQSSHVTQLGGVMQERGQQMRSAAHVLANLAYYKPQIFVADHLDPLIQVSAHAAPSFFSNKALAQLARNRRDLFTDDIIARMKAANENPDEIYRGCLQQALDILAPNQSPPVAVPAPPRYVAPAPQPIPAPALVMPPKATVPGHIQVAEVLQIAPDMVATHLEAIAHVTREGLVILTRCQNDATFRDTLTTALQHMQREATYSSWLAEALRQVQMSAATRSSLELD